MEVQMGPVRITLILFFTFVFALSFSSSSFATIGDVSRQTEKFKAKNKKRCAKKIDEFIAAVTPYSLGPDDGPESPGECMECREIKRKFKKLTSAPKGPVGCKVVGECTVVEDSFCEGLTPMD